MLSQKILALDITSTGAQIGVVDENGSVLFTDKYYFHSQDINEIIKLTYDDAQKLLEKNGFSYANITKVSIDVPGYIDHFLGIIDFSANLNAKNWPIKDAAKKVFKRPVYILNDANAAALGEYWIGSATQYDSILFYTIDSGIGGAIISEDKIYLGSRGYAGEFGHGGGYHDKYVCPCGLVGCVEVVCNEEGIKREIINLFSQESSHPASVYFKDYSLNEINSQLIYDVYIKNNKPTEIFKLMFEVLKPLIRHMSTMTTSLDPDAIIISGSVARMNTLLFSVLKSGLQKMTIEKFVQNLAIEEAILGPNAAMIGAAFFALKEGDIDEISNDEEFIDFDMDV